MNKNTDLLKARLGVLEGLQKHDVTSDETASVVARVASAVSRGTISDARNYGSVAAFNFVVDRKRRHRGGAAQLKRDIPEIQERLRRNRVAAVAVPELEKILSHCRDTATKLQAVHLDMVRAVYIDGASLPATEELWPDSTRDQRYQWKRRGLKLIWNRASETLKTYLQDPATHSGSAVRRAPEAV